MNEAETRKFLAALFDTAVDAASPDNSVPHFLPKKPKGRVIVVGAGKASAQMARAFEDAWFAEYGEAVSGVVVTRYGYGCECKNIEILEASHPVPDKAGLAGSKRLLSAVSGLTADDLVVALISGGGSALLPSPPAGLTLDDEIAINEMLLASGAPISAMNTVRKHVSSIKGGRLAAAAFPARTVSLLVSDIPGDHAHFIASGPTVADPADRGQALDIVRQYKMGLPEHIINHLQSDAANAPLPNDPELCGATHHIVASAAISLEAAAGVAKTAGIDAVILSDAIEGEAREAAKSQAAIAKEVLQRDRPFKKPVLLLSGGETTVTINGSGRGGPNTEFMLSLALEISGHNGIFALGADTDGIDGSGNNAGAFVDSQTVLKMIAAGVDPVSSLQNNDAWTAFDKVDALFIPGPTGTNVNDFRAVLITG